MKSGVVLSINKRFVTLLTPEGEFLKTKRQGRPYKVGEEIAFSPMKPKFTFTFSNFHLTAKKTLVISLTSSFLVLFSILPSLFTEHVSAYMTIDVNPSIELELNNELEVLTLTGLNGDGKLVIKELTNWKGKNIKTVTNRIVKTTRQLGYLEGKKKIVVSTTLLDNNKKLDKELKTEIKKVSIQDNISQTKIKIISATKSDRNHAREQGMSTGKYVEKKLDEDREKIKGETKETEKGKQVERSISSKNTSIENKVKQKEEEMLPANKKVTKENKAEVQLPLKHPKEISLKEQSQKEKTAKQQPQKEKTLKQERHKEKATKQERTKEKGPKQEQHKEKAAKQERSKERAPGQEQRKEKAQKQKPQKEKGPKQEQHKEKAAKQERSKERAPGQEQRKEKAQKQKPQKEKGPKQEQHKEKTPKQGHQEERAAI